MENGGLRLRLKLRHSSINSKHRAQLEGLRIKKGELKALTETKCRRY